VNGGDTLARDEHSVRTPTTELPPNNHEHTHRTEPPSGLHSHSDLPNLPILFVPVLTVDKKCHVHSCVTLHSSPQTSSSNSTSLSSLHRGCMYCDVLLLCRAHIVLFVKSVHLMLLQHLFIIIGHIFCSLIS